jgi:hypothetical protein
MRRTTLGGLSSSQLNARPSLAGSRLGALGEGGGKALPPPAPRAERSLGDLGAAQSLAGAAGAPISRGSLQRRTSVYSGSGSALRQVRGVSLCIHAAGVAALPSERSGQGLQAHRAGRAWQPRAVRSLGCTPAVRSRLCCALACACACCPSCIADRVARPACRTRGP